MRVPTGGATPPAHGRGLGSLPFGALFQHLREVRLRPLSDVRKVPGIEELRNNAPGGPLLRHRVADSREEVAMLIVDPGTVLGDLIAQARERIAAERRLLDHLQSVARLG